MFWLHEGFSEVTDSLKASKESDGIFIPLVPGFLGLSLFLLYLVEPILCILDAIVNQETILLAFNPFQHSKNVVNRLIGGFSRTDLLAFKFEISSLLDMFIIRLVDMLMELLVCLKGNIDAVALAIERQYSDRCVQAQKCTRNVDFTVAQTFGLTTYVCFIVSG